MFKSVFSKYIAAFMLILVTCLLSVGVVIIFVFTQYTVNTKSTIVDRCSESVLEYLQTRNVTNDEDGFEYVINREYDSLNSFLSSLTFLDDELVIFVCDIKGAVVNCSDVPYGTLKNDIPGQQLQKINSSDSKIKVDFYDVFDADYRCYATPIIGKNLKNIGSICVCTSSATMTRMVTNVVRVMGISMIVATLVALGAIYFISRRISAPLKKMSAAAKKFAKGDFEERVPVTGRDEVAKLAIAFNNMANKLDDIENQRRSFLSNIAHDLRTPMTTISGFIDNILSGAIPVEKYDYYLGVIGKEVKRLSRLVSLLLDITRIESGTRKFIFDSVDVCEIARQVLISNEQRLEEKKLDVEFVCDNENIYVNADTDAIHQCIYNICDNAIKFSKEGGKYRISIETNDKKVYVSVFNEGVGIAESELPHIFDRFYKSDKSRGLDKTGVGLGLYIVKTIINAHGGDIWVKSKYKENCEFVFTLNLAEKKPNKLK